MIAATCVKSVTILNVPISYCFHMVAGYPEDPTKTQSCQSLREWEEEGGGGGAGGACTEIGTCSGNTIDITDGQIASWLMLIM